MLPARMRLNKLTEDNLKRLKANTGITPNVASRIAFFRSIESGFRYKINHNLDGNLVLDKHTWCGDLGSLIENTLLFTYPDFDEKSYEKAWAAHVENGIAGIRNYSSLSEFADAI
ncbi:DNA sulfur modification protein DndE [Thalassomonas sp. M1454]|uniref:DNA sulfur modification protein DndE n=1 Tax=Thalassomonas sp. M1454 TaxID=2594477 RepID=UPI00117CF35A|nr:DNA sulfur modification protein DndE [Thalassomonas sp. M1454]TRX56694.1 DNA sulfur modification protein DndE [Thalassomonas sp. M1454]